MFKLLSDFLGKAWKARNSKFTFSFAQTQVLKLLKEIFPQLEEMYFNFPHPGKILYHNLVILIGYLKN